MVVLGRIGSRAHETILRTAHKERAAGTAEELMCEDVQPGADRLDREFRTVAPGAVDASKSGGPGLLPGCAIIREVHGVRAHVETVGHHHLEGGAAYPEGAGRADTEQAVESLFGENAAVHGVRERVFVGANDPIERIDLSAPRVDPSAPCGEHPHYYEKRLSRATPILLLHIRSLLAPA